MTAETYLLGLNKSNPEKEALNEPKPPQAVRKSLAVWRGERPHAYSGYPCADQKETPLLHNAWAIMAMSRT